MFIVKFSYSNGKVLKRKLKRKKTLKFQNPSGSQTESCVRIDYSNRSIKFSYFFFSLEMRGKITNDVSCFSNQLFILSNFEAQASGIPFVCCFFDENHYACAAIKYNEIKSTATHNELIATSGTGAWLQAS